MIPPQDQPEAIVDHTAACRRVGVSLGPAMTRAQKVATEAFPANCRHEQNSSCVICESWTFPQITDPPSGPLP
jgi:hypothetical protein